MTWDQYWFGDVRMTEAFFESDREWQKRRNEEAWLQGLYFYDALGCALKNAFRKKHEPPAKYPEQPYDFSHKKKKATIDDGMTCEERELLLAKIALDNERRASRAKNWGGF